MAKPKAKTETEAEDPVRFTKEQIIHSERYGESRDILAALLVDDQTYSDSELEGLINAFKSRRIE